MTELRDDRRDRLVMHRLNIPYDLSQKIRRLAAASGATMTQIIVDSVADFLSRGAAHELDERFALRLDRLSRGNQRMEREVVFIAEALGAFVQHQLTLVAHQPAFDVETAKLGRLRYEALLEIVSRRIARSRQVGASKENPEDDARILASNSDRDNE
jgi:predicted transcriptional regulator